MLLKSANPKIICAFYFLFVWSIYGLFINVKNQNDYNLQQMGVDAIVTHHTFELGHSKLPIFTPGGDTFQYHGRTYAAKQPGQFVIASIPYALLNAVGISYESRYDLAASFVTWLSSSLLAALAGTFLLYLFLSSWMMPGVNSLFCALVFNFATGMFVYAGVTHHDTMATALATISYVVFEKSIAGLLQRDSKRSFALSGFLAGATLFVSMLLVPVTVCFVLRGVFLLRRHRRECGLFILSFGLGLVPIFLYNWYCFDSPFLPPNIAGGYSDTYPHLSIERILWHLRAYIGDGGISLVKYYPIMIFGVLAPAFFRFSYRDPRILFCWGACLAHLLFICSIETVGDCQFGPRYLLPFSAYSIIPLSILGQKWAQNTYHRIFRGMEYSLATYSALVAASGAIIATMWCDIDKWQPAKLFQLTDLWVVSRYPLLGIASGIFAATTVILFAVVSRNAKTLAQGSSSKNLPLTLEKVSIAVIAIVAIVFFLLRFVGMEFSPRGFYVDEAAGATNILCLAQHGKDGNGVSWPLFSEGLNAGLYTPFFLYSGVVWTKLFGSSVTAFREMSAFYSAATILFLYGIGLHFTNRRGALLTGAAAALSPWIFHSARIAWDPSLLSCFIVAGIYFYLTALSWKKAIASGVMFAAAMYTYPTARVQIPLVIAALTILPLRARMNVRKLLLPMLITLCVVSVPLVVGTFYGPLGNRFQMLNALSEDRLQKKGLALILAAVLELIHNLSLHLSFKFLFLNGDGNLRHSTGAFGQLSWLDALGVVAFVSLGLWICLRSNKQDDSAGIKSFFAAIAFCAMGFFAGILPASMTWNSLPHALRSTGAAPFVALFTGLVLYQGCIRLKWLWSLSAIISVSFAVVFGSYFFRTFPNNAEVWFDADLKSIAESPGHDPDWILKEGFANYPELARKYYKIHYLNEPCP